MCPRQILIMLFYSKAYCTDISLTQARIASTRDLSTSRRFFKQALFTIYDLSVYLFHILSYFFFISYLLIYFIFFPYIVVTCYYFIFLIYAFEDRPNMLPLNRATYRLLERVRHSLPV